MPLLSHDEILKLHAAVVSARLLESRLTLLVGVNPGFVAGLPRAVTSSDQVLQDLDALNAAGALADDTVPLAIWLLNAVARAGMQKEAALFKAVLEKVGGPAGLRGTAREETAAIGGPAGSSTAPAAAVILPAPGAPWKSSTAIRGCTEWDLGRLPDKDTPKLIPRKGIKPAEMYFLGQDAPTGGRGAGAVEPRARTEVDPPELGGAAVRRLEDERYDARVARIIDGVAATLEKRSRIAAALAQKLQLSAVPGEVARIVATEMVRVRKAGETARALNDVDSKLANDAADLEDRRAVRTILWQILPFVIDWRQLVVTGRVTLASGTNAIDLPLRTGTVAEIVLAGINEQCCKFAPLANAGMPVGAALVRLPAAAQTALFDVDGTRLAQLIVQQLAAEVSIEAQYTRYPDMRDAVEGTLRYHAREAPEDEILPYYLLFVDADLGEKEGAHDLWALARTVIGRELPSLRLVRLTGGALQDEMVLAKHIEAIMRRTP